MKLRELIQGLPLTWLVDGDPTISSIAVDSRLVTPGSLYFAREGWFIDSHQFIPQAVAAGASAIVVTRPDAVPPACPVPVLVSTNEDRDLGLLADRFFAHPTHRLLVVGVTGTNGKTSVAWMTAAVLEARGHRPIVIGTVGHAFAGRVVNARNTTPDGLFIHGYAAQCLAQGATALVMEVSSHGLQLQRIAGVAFDVVAFTNLTPDHLDYHKTFDAYREAKALLFSSVVEYSRAQGKSPVRVINISSQEGMSLAERHSQQSDALMTVCTSDSRRDDARLVVDATNRDVTGSSGSVYLDAQPFPFVLHQPGAHNLENLAVVCGIAASVNGSQLLRGIDALQGFAGVPGRLELVAAQHAPEGPAFVDYAHTPDATVRISDVIVQSGQGGDSHIVLGAGGNRDRSKRPLMLQAALLAGGHVTITADNPRDERPEDICAQMCEGELNNPRVTVELDRARAICGAIDRAPAGGVWILGKGHERTQEIAGQFYHFDDAQWARWALTRRRQAIALADVPFVSGWSLRDLARITGARVHGQLTRTLGPWFTDTRAPVVGGLFVALVGERHDAHDHLQAAVDAGARCLLVSRPPAMDCPIPWVQVDDTLAALTALAKQALVERRTMMSPLWTIGLTGSNGKTTTKEMVAALLRARGQSVLATPGNWNNEIGVPLTVGGLCIGHDCAVLEMGAGAPGDIAHLAAIGGHDVGVVTSIGPAHLERLGGLDGVRREKARVLVARPDTVAVVPLDERDRLLATLERAPATVWTFGGVGADLTVEVSGDVALLSGPGGWVCEVPIPLGGYHNACNLAAAILAISANRAGGLELPAAALVQQAMATLQVSGGRLRRVPMAGRLVIDDAYNANPASVAASLSLLKAAQGVRVAVLGGMEELGDRSEELHRQTGAVAASCADLVVAVGPRAQAIADGAGEVAVWVNTIDEAVERLAMVAAPATLLVKASRAARLERVVQGLATRWGA
jgi:murE/murF fusion protein